MPVCAVALSPCPSPSRREGTPASAARFAFGRRSLTGANVFPPPWRGGPGRGGNPLSTSSSPAAKPSNGPSHADHHLPDLRTAARNRVPLRRRGACRPPAATETLADQEVAERLYFRTNPKGVHAERWRHVHGCGKFFNAVRDTTTDFFETTYPAGAPRPAPTEKEGGR